MDPNRKKAYGLAAIIGSSVLAGAIGAAIFGPGAAGAQTGTPTPKATSGTFRSNEDPAHEAGESAQREADENSGKFQGHFGRFGSNEDKAHEAGESPQREAEENARQSQSGSSGSSSTPSASG